MRIGVVARRALLLVTAAVLATAATWTVAPPRGESALREPGWVGSWAAAMVRPDSTGVTADGFSDATLRQVVRLSAGGDRIRLRLSNVFGAAPLTVARVTVAPALAGAAPAAAGRVVPVSWDGRQRVTVATGAESVSDPVRMAVGGGRQLVVSMYVDGATGPLTQHPQAAATAWLAPGDATAAGPAPFRAVGEFRALLTGVDVHGPATRAVVFFGDSLTNGTGSSVGRNARYPDRVADRMLRRPAARRFGVLNAGISGNRLLADRGTRGEAAMARFRRDVLSQPGVSTVVLLEGVNDIQLTRGEVDAGDLIAVQRQLIAVARAHHLRVVGATLLPYRGWPEYTPAGERDRQRLNRWIRTSGEFDAVVDLDAALRDPDRPRRLLPAYDSGDHLHPNDAGYAAMAAAVDPALL